LRLCEKQTPTRHCEAQHAVAPNVNHALKQSQAACVTKFQIASATQINKSVSACRGLAMTNKTFAPLRRCEKQTPTRHCEAQRAVAPKVKHALKQSETCTVLLRLLQPRK
jgi:hypothetical protein